VVTPAQWLALAAVARDRANGTIRLTTRETIQFHGILKGNLRPAMQAIDAALLDTIAACGDVNRNVIAAVLPQRPALYGELISLARTLSQNLLPRTRAWHEIWLGEELVAGGEVEEDPIYGQTYLPRKFKIAIAVPPLNDVDVFAHDLGLIAIEENGRVVGYNVSVGGGMGMTHGEPDTFPRTGDVIGFCTPDQVAQVAEKVLIVQRDNGDRAVRKHARLKYTIERLSLARFIALLEAELGFALAPARSFHFSRTGDALGWVQGEDGLWHHTIFVENGRVQDDGTRRQLSALAAIAQTHDGVFVLTANQNLMISGVSAARKPGIDALLAEHGLAVPQSGLRRNSMACVALPTCGLALAESERYLPTLIDDLERVLAENGLSSQEIVIRMTGCPNGCARPYLAEIGLVGRGPGIYNLYLGGAFDGTRLNKLVARDLPHDGIIAMLRPLFAAYAQDRENGEHFSDWVIRAGHVKATSAGNRFHADLAAGLSGAASPA
jgi:sulfite reductase (NADPH) hemoprotein beta-component